MKHIDRFLSGITILVGIGAIMAVVFFFIKWFMADSTTETWRWISGITIVVAIAYFIGKDISKLEKEATEKSVQDFYK